MSIDEADALAMEERYALAEEDLSDEAVEAPDLTWPADAPVAGVPASFPKDDRIEDEAGLVRAFASLRRATRALEQNRRMQAPVLEEARRELEALEAKCAKANAALEARAEHHRNRIEVYARTHRDELVQGKRKTRDFGIGSVSFRMTGGEYRWRKDLSASTREAMLLRWATDRTGPTTPLTKMERVFDLSAVKAYADDMTKRDQADTGTFERVTPPGLEYVPEHEELKIAVEDDK